MALSTSPELLDHLPFLPPIPRQQQTPTSQASGFLPFQGDPAHTIRTGPPPIALGQPLFPLLSTLHGRKTAKVEMVTSQSCWRSQVTWDKVEKGLAEKADAGRGMRVCLGSAGCARRMRAVSGSSHICRQSPQDSADAGEQGKCLGNTVLSPTLSLCPSHPQLPHQVLRKTVTKV